MMAAARAANATLVAVLTTHNHWDHAGGNNQIKALVPGLAITGGQGDEAEGVTREVWQDDVVEIGALRIGVLATPCHTPGHVSYVVPPLGGEPGAVFTGDTLFVAGCGNFNAGTPEQMYTALYERIGALPVFMIFFC